MVTFRSSSIYFVFGFSCLLLAGLPLAFSYTIFQGGINEIQPDQVTYVTAGTLEQENRNYASQSEILIGLTPINTINILYLQFSPQWKLENYDGECMLRLHGVWNGYVPADFVYLTFMISIFEEDWDASTLTYSSTEVFDQEFLYLQPFLLSNFQNGIFDFDILIPEFLFNVTSLSRYSMSITLLETQGMDTGFFGYCVLTPNTITLQLEYRGIQPLWLWIWGVSWISLGGIFLFLAYRKTRIEENEFYGN